MTIMKAVVLDGSVINIGEWDLEPEDGVTNPLPEGAETGEFDISITSDGRYVLASNYAELRKAEYPSIGDQLDALYKAGVLPEYMAEQIKAVKDKYPKTCQYYQ